MSEIVDLDALLPKPATIKWGDEEITVQPPKVYTVLRVADFWQNTRLAAAIPEKELIETIDNLKAEIVKCIPQLEGKELSYGQITALVTLLTKMTLPPEEVSDKKGKVTTGDTPDPKDPSGS